MLFTYGTSTAHPHMFIDVSLKFMLSDDGLAGVYVYWDIDEMNSAWIIEDFDKNRNGAFEQNEQKAIFAEAFSKAASDNYFMSMTWGLESMDSVDIEQFSASLKNKRTVVYSFYVPCNLRISAMKCRDIYLFFDDPSIYIAFDLKKNLVQASINDHIEGKVTFTKIDYSDAAVLHLARK